MNIEEENKKFQIAKELALKDMPKETIGVLQEHTLHRCIKFYLSNDLEYQEVPINKMFADVKIGDNIYEVQTKSFNAMREKLTCFLQDYNVTIVHPMALNKYVYLMNDYGEVISEKKSPKHSSPLEIMWELYKIKPFLKSENLHFMIIMMDMYEYRTQVEKKHYRSKGFIRDNQIPLKIDEIYEIKNMMDFKQILLKYNLPEVFNSKVFAKSCHLTQKKAITALNVLTYGEVVKRIGKEKNSYLYQVV